MTHLHPPVKQLSILSNQSQSTHLKNTHMPPKVASKPLSINYLVEASKNAIDVDAPSDTTLTLSKEWKLPPRPKPGRKPLADDDSSCKRRLQNREAQRAFRQRRTDRLQELKDQVDELTKAKHQMEIHLQSVIQKLRHENATLKQHIRGLKAVNETSGKLEKTDFECGVCVKDDCLCESVGMEKKADPETEIDFTAQFAAKQKPRTEAKCDLCEGTVCVCQEAVALANLCQPNHDK